MFKEDIDELEKITEEKETAPEIQPAIIGSIMGMWSGNRLTHPPLAVYTLVWVFLSKAY